MSVANTEQELLDAMEPVNIPEQFPDLLFQFSKAAIRTQPVDILAWSAEYVSFVATALAHAWFRSQVLSQLGKAPSIGTDDAKG